MTELKEHWENIYAKKSFEEVSWFQKHPETSIGLIDSCRPGKDDKIIDIGGGDSYLAEHFLKTGFSAISVLDISQNVLNRAQERIGPHSSNITWLCSDIVDFKPSDSYQIWHDRAVFHFLTSNDEISKYVSLVNRAIHSGGYLILGTFAKDGPTKCSGLEISQYDTDHLEQLFTEFELVSSHRVDHETPFDSIQKFTFVVFKKR